MKGARRSAAGKLDFLGDFDEQGQLVETPYRPQLAKKPITGKPRHAAKPSGKDAENAPPTHDRFTLQPPNPWPLSRRPTPADLTLDHSRDILLTAFGKATLTDRYLMPGA